jgi:hypothetical protein
MFTESGVIELCGGRFDGYRKALRHVPLADRLKLHVPSSSLADPPSSSCVAVYERGPTGLILWNNLPTLVYRYEFTRIEPRTSPSPSRGITGWMARLRRALPRRPIRR